MRCQKSADAIVGHSTVTEGQNLSVREEPSTVLQALAAEKRVEIPKAHTGSTGRKPGDLA